MVEERYTVRAAIRRWLMLTRARTRTYRVYGGYWDNLWGRRLLAAITVADLREWQLKRLREVKASTVQAQMVSLSCVYRQAIEDGRATENIVKKLGWLKLDNARTRWFSEEEVVSIRAACRLDSWDYVQFLLHTGLRIGELLALEWGDVERGQVYIKPAKTNKGRWIPLTPSAQAVLARRAHLERPFPIGYRSIALRFANVLRRAGVLNASLHTCRHSFATRLVQRGVPLYRVKVLLGHNSLKMTERYSHHSQHDLSEAVMVLED